MILIADSGASKADWRLIDTDGNIQQFQTLGINPYHQKTETIRNEIMESLKPKISVPVHQLFFYGAGCSSESNIQALKSVFEEAFPNAVVTVDHDLIGAARSLCGYNPGIACILGTGANSCYYDGDNIVSNVPSLGFIMGDEGSGAWLGKKLLGSFIRGELGEELEGKLVKRFDLDRNGILENVYQKPFAARYMAGFSKFIFQNIKHPVLYRLVYQGFELFFEKNVEKYDQFRQLPVHFTGSVAFYYSNILRQVANDRGIAVRNIVESPIAGLTLYHQNSVMR
ncbi:N-acetylglucosamine kinase [Fulvivirga sp. 29W222]|uniref:N-acetylglucosamine kinase n=1 Tax=Fulvivirga marina TaxID=2494733 RepID=A0A937G2U6_9BACT|nr:N-acetylglucosamine kinase [Fulvivirga marina]MBL6449662.1 N-acetylglucosamine kinase [Fulvivirga marina]